jgi:hypothetical protein
MWLPPPLAEHYRQLSFDPLDRMLRERGGKPVVMISNKYQDEWGEEPVNFLDLETLETLFSLLSPKYLMVYCREGERDRYGDFNLTDAYPEMLVCRDLKGMFPEAASMTDRHFQLLFLSRTSAFVSVQGGKSHLLAMFDGVHIVYHARGHEDDTVAAARGNTEYDLVDRRLSNQQLLICRNNRACLVDLAKQYLV